MQKEMPILGTAGYEVKDLPSEWVAACDNWRQAVELCMDKSVVAYTREQWASKIDMTPGTLSGILRQSGKRKRNLDPSYFALIQQIAGNHAIDQFFRMESLGQLNCQSRKSRLDQLKEEVERLEAEELSNQSLMWG